MHCTHIPYEQTGFFSKIVIDYLNKDPKLQPFYQHVVSLEGIKASILARKSFPTNRKLLVQELETQYVGLLLSAKQRENLQSLLNENTFTITTAHQPNIFTGPLYFIYKIIHAIKLADELGKQLPDYQFVPVYYMGSEDADLDELGYINLNGEKLVWETNQTGAVGRMKVDKQLLKIIDCIHGQIGVNTFGDELIELFTKCYTEGKTIQQATFQLVNELFTQFGLLVLIPDNAALKNSFRPVIQKELEEQFSHRAVETTINQLNSHYKVQAAGRDLNLFYLLDNKRERIEFQGDKFVINNLNIEFSKDEIISELENFPERFSANVILRGVFQETILPNIAFIGGGGELAYWLELKQVFKEVAVPYPMLIIRNSFLFIDNKYNSLINNLKLGIVDLFKSEFDLVNQLVKTESANQLSIAAEVAEMEEVYSKLASITQKIDPTLSNHVEALRTKSQARLLILEKKMLRAEKRKFQEWQQQVQNLKSSLFPNNSLQERTENFSLVYSKLGKEWLQAIYQISPSLEQHFTVANLSDL